MSEIKPCPTFTPEVIEAANIETERLCRELDITNADHIALWLESWLEDDCSVAFLACRIIEAHEAHCADLTASRDRASDACASVQKERDDLRDFMEEAKRLLGQISKSDWASIDEMKGIGIELGPESTAFAREIGAFLARYEGGRA